MIEDAIESKRFVIFFQSGVRTALEAPRIADSPDAGAVGVFSPELEGKTLTFDQRNGTILDQQTGSSWNILGVATNGPLAAGRLEPIEHTVTFTFAWLAFRPDRSSSSLCISIIFAWLAPHWLSRIWPVSV